MHKRTCPHCKGSGKVLDNTKVGKKLRRLREMLNIKASYVAEMMGFRPSYISELENGKRNWDEKKITEYKKAIGA